MDKRILIGRKMQDHYDKVWQAGDAWSFESSEFEQARFARQAALLGGRHYRRVLEIGCGSGRLTRLLATLADGVVALDIAAAAVERARVQAAGTGPGAIDFRVANVMEYDVQAEGPWDLVVLSETVYCLGWLYPFFDVAWLAAQLFAATRIGGRFLLANTYGGEKDWLLRPWLIHTYRDLFVNVGYQLETEEVFRGVKEGVPIEVLISLFEKRDGERGTPPGPGANHAARDDR